jgi:voltage-gated potassium channel
MKSPEKKHLLSNSTANKILFGLLLTMIFVVPALPISLHQLSYISMFTFIIVIGTQLISRNKKLIFTITIVAIAMVWTGDLMDLRVIEGISKGVNIILYFIIVVDLVKQVSIAKKVSPTVILESVNAYLMIGLVFTLAVAILMSLDQGSFSFGNLRAGSLQYGFPMHLYIYYTFITLTTVGYGDIVPLTPIARSLSTLISVSGQLYVALVIALLVGKYISQESRSEYNSEE